MSVLFRLLIFLLFLLLSIGHLHHGVNVLLRVEREYRGDRYLRHSLPSLSLIPPFSQVICRENSEVVSPSRCSHLDRVESEQKCMNRPCGEWTVGEWQSVRRSLSLSFPLFILPFQCPVSCGSAEESRSVSCVSTTNSSLILPDTTCDVEKRPEVSRHFPPLFIPLSLPVNSSLFHISVSIWKGISSWTMEISTMD